MIVKTVNVREFLTVIEKLKGTCGVIEFAMVGSAVYREDAADVDILVYAHTSFAEPLPWKHGVGSMSDDDRATGIFNSYRDMDYPLYNYIVTSDKDWYDRCKLASDLCAELKLPTKRDRCLLHRVVRDGMDLPTALQNI